MGPDGPAGRGRRALAWLAPSLRSLRARVTVVASLAVTATIVAGMLGLFLLQKKSVDRTVDGQLRTYAAQIVQSASAARWPRTLAHSTLDPTAAAQVLSANGRVLAATASLAGLPAVYTLAPGATVPVRQKAANRALPSNARVFAMRTTVDGRPVTIVTGTSTDLLREANSEFLRHLLLGLPVILGLAAITVWLVVGRALRPVEKIRAAVTDITSAGLSRRVPEPGTSDEIARLAQTMNDMLSRLDGAAQSQRRFVADASHELRSPLAAIRTTLEVGLAHPDKAPWPVIADRAVQQSARLEDLIRQLLLLAKADERLLPARPEPVDLGSLLADIRDTTVRHDHLEIRLGTSPGVMTKGDPDHLQRLFRNIVDNALRYADRHVLIRASPARDMVAVEIDDDGPGIPAAQRERVFDRFVRLDASRDRASGSTGLGLAIAREIASAHGGDIMITDSPAGGTRVVVHLPLISA